MSYGFGFIDVLVSPVTMATAVIIFLFCCGLLLFKRKTISRDIKPFVVFGAIVTGVYTAFIVWAVIGFGGGFR